MFHEHNFSTDLLNYHSSNLTRWMWEENVWADASILLNAYPGIKLSPYNILHSVEQQSKQQQQKN